MKEGGAERGEGREAKGVSERKQHQRRDEGKRRRGGRRKARRRTSEPQRPRRCSQPGPFPTVTMVEEGKGRRSAKCREKREDGSARACRLTHGSPFSCIIVSMVAEVENVVISSQDPCSRAKVRRRREIKLTFVERDVERIVLKIFQIPDVRLQPSHRRSRLRVLPFHLFNQC